jgi:hypothetical protein
MHNSILEPAPTLPSLHMLLGDHASLSDAAVAEWDDWVRGGTLFDAAVALGVVVRHVRPDGLRLPPTGDVVRAWALGLSPASVERLEREACVLAATLAQRLEALDEVDDFKVEADLMTGIVRLRDALASCLQTLAAAGRPGRLRAALSIVDDEAIAQLDRVLRLPEDDFTRAVADVDVDAWWGLRLWR